MIIHCVHAECRFIGGEGYPDPLLIKNYRADVRADIGERLCNEFPYLFAKQPWSVGERQKTVYAAPAEPEAPTWVAGIVEGPEGAELTVTLGESADDPS